MGCESVYLRKHGYDVVSNEIEEVLADEANLFARQMKVTLAPRRDDWLDFADRHESGSFDAILLLGNSLCLLRGVEEMKKAIVGFHKILRHKGILIVDERNFKKIIKNKEMLLQEHQYMPPKGMYLGNKIKATPLEIYQNIKLLVMGYYNMENKQIIGTLDLYMYDENELEEMLKNNGFIIKNIYSDFKEGKDPNAEFYTYVAEANKNVNNFNNLTIDDKIFIEKMKFKERYDLI
jgi:SAM-dependent methyltransferase